MACPWPWFCIRQRRAPCCPGQVLDTPSIRVPPDPRPQDGRSCSARLAGLATLWTHRKPHKLPQCRLALEWGGGVPICRLRDNCGRVSVIVPESKEPPQDPAGGWGGGGAQFRSQTLWGVTNSTPVPNKEMSHFSHPLLFLPKQFPGLHCLSYKIRPSLCFY